MGLVHINGSHLRGQDHLVVIRDVIAGGTQAVAVKNCPQHIPVTEHNGSRAVPWLHHGGIIPIEIHHFLGHVLLMGPGRRDGDHHRQGQFHAAHHHEFQGIVQHGRIRALLVDDGQNLMHFRLKETGLHGLLSGHHLVHISPDGVDLPVMDDNPVGMSAHPAGIGVGAEPGVDHRQGRLVIRILQIVKKLT